jgi:hypothetical protein
MAEQLGDTVVVGRFIAGGGRAVIGGGDDLDVMG